MGLKDKIIELLNKGELPINLIAVELNITDEMQLINTIAEMEMDKIVVQSGMKPYHDGEGALFYTAIYAMCGGSD